MTPKTMIPSFMKKLPSNKKKTTTLYSPHYQKHGEAPLSSHSQLQGEQLAGSQQPKQSIKSQYFGADTTKIEVNDKLLTVEKSASATIPGHHYIHGIEKKQEEQHQERICNDDGDDNDDDDNFLDAKDEQEVDDIDDKECLKGQSRHLPPTSRSASEPALTSIKPDEVKLGSRVALLERAIELGWIKKIFSRRRATEEQRQPTRRETGKAETQTTIIPPADFPNESTKNIHALVDQYHSHDSTPAVDTCQDGGKSQEELVNEQEYEYLIQQIAHLPIFQAFYKLAAAPGETVEEPPDANPVEFDAYCDKILFGRYK